MNSYRGYNITGYELWFQWPIVHRGTISAHVGLFCIDPPECVWREHYNVRVTALQNLRRDM